MSSREAFVRVAVWQDRFSFAVWNVLSIVSRKGLLD